ncbi:hypothetical protein [Winogradskyella sp.]|uniref:GldL-related protein n=1 Tax=Winogradskyella sp. TaxID=1883156 RepID=UPI0025D6E35D|nr:hypothetical protein [Winogradskyella sp.]MCT4628724.1 hypothetical protein [Winogradskyella sp.]
MKNIQKKILTFPLRIALIILIIGALFKIMHWPYANRLMLIGGVSISILYLIRFLYKKPKNKIDFVKLSLVFLWLINYLIDAFHVFNIPYLFEALLVALFIWWFTEEGVFYFKNRKFKRKGIIKMFYYLICYLTLLALSLGILIKIQHWPYGSLIFVLGVLLLCLVLILDYFLIEHK